MLDLTIDSVSVNVNGRKIEFYPLNFKALRLLSKDFEMLRSGTASTMDRLDAIVNVLTASANRMQQQISPEEMDELFDPVWATKVLDEVNKLSGMRAIPKDEDGEAVRPTKPPNGELSTQQ